MELTIVFLIIVLICTFYTLTETLCESFHIENLTNEIGLDVNQLKKQDYTRYKSLIFGESPQFTNTILS